MADITEQLHESFLVSRIGEMGSLESMTDDLIVPSDFLDKVKAKDDDPVFVTVEVESGFSESKRNWKPEHVKQVVDMVNQKKMSGNLGHPLVKPDEYDTAFPEPQVVWVAAKMREAGNKAIGKFKGYVLKGAKAREYLPLGLIDGVSWFGNTTLRPRPGGGYEVIKFEPENLDFARKGRSGLNSRVLSLAGEMGTKGVLQVEPREIAALSPAEVREHAPLVFKAIQDEGKTDLETKVGEQATAIAALEPEAEIATKVRELLGLSEGENVIEKITSLMESIEEGAKTEIKDFVNSLIEKKVKTTRGKAIVNRLLGEMHSEYDGPLTDDLKTKIETDFEAILDSDEDIKKLVGEMSSWSEETSRQTSGGSQLGGRTSGGDERGREDLGNGDGSVVRRTSRLTVRKRTLA